MLSSLKYYWLINLLIVAAVAVAAATITGALLVGDSVRGSLRDLTLDRLGEIDQVLLAPRFFAEDLATRLETHSQDSVPIEKAEPLIALHGSLVKPRSNRRASQVNVFGVGADFAGLFGTSLPLARREGQAFPSIVINQSVQQELDVQVGDQILVYLQRESAIHRESLMGRRDPEHQINSLRVEVSSIIPDRGAGRFSLRPEQSEPLNAFLELGVLQGAVERSGQVNALVVNTASGAQGSEPLDLRPLLQSSLQPADLGFKVIEGEGFFVLESDQFVLPPSTVDQIRELARNQNRATQSVITYLANQIRVGESAIPYSTVSGVEFPVPSGFPQLGSGEGSVKEISEGGIILNEWAARDLNAHPGDAVELSYYVVGPAGALDTDSVELRLAAVVPIQGLAADSHLTPDFPGISEAEDMRAWDPPFPVDLDQIRPKDEEYWDEHRALPKAFVRFSTGARLWSSRFGTLTSIRIEDVDGSGGRSFTQSLVRQLDPQFSGFVFQPVKEQGLVAANGPTDFSGLFIGFSLFLIVSALLIVAMLFRLSTERRSPEVGLLLSVGFTPRRVLGRLLAEGAVLSALGAALGLLGAVAYAGLMMAALRTWWRAAVGTSFLYLHVTSLSLGLGYLIAVFAVLFSIWLAIRRMVRLPKPDLLRGIVEKAIRPKSGGRAAAISLISLILAIGLLVWGILQVRAGAGSETVSTVFFLVGALLLTSGLCAFSAYNRRSSLRGFDPRASLPLLRMAMRNGSRNPQRSVLSAALVACACFVIVSVGMFRISTPAASLDRGSGTGGFALVATSDIPILQNLSDEDDRFELGLPDSGEIQDANFFSLRVLPGDDASCLNLYKPRQPRVLGAPQSLIERGGFTIDTEQKTDQPWTLLQEDLGEDVIPAFGDQESVLWILKLGLGDELEFVDGHGKRFRVRLVGLVQNSIFQSELLISEENFLKHFPRRSGYEYFLIDSSLEEREALSAQLEDRLTRYGFDATPADEKLARFQAVRSTYISTFQTLGGFGLLLGTIGLGVILVRNVVERRRELATLRAFGFKRSDLARMVVAENAFLLLVGVVLGGGAALVAVSPVAAGGEFPLLSLGLTLLGVLVTGMLACLIAVRAALRIPMLPALKAE